MEVREYVRENGTNPYQQWFDRLDAIAAAKVTVAKSRLELGNTSNIKWFDGIGEYRIDWGPGYRIYLAREGKEIIILLGGDTKKNQQSDIDRARELYREYKQRKKEMRKTDTQATIAPKKRKKRKRP
ncbi:MAG: type II toxin-antitoxin system RelE/ParE family toxin [Cyanobacteria bacterium P01_D01_bin.123]